jgi:putative oxidoreductase
LDYLLIVYWTSRIGGIFNNFASRKQTIKRFYMKSSSTFPQLFLRTGLGLGYLSADADRVGLWGPHGGHNIAWGDWSHFYDYTHSMLSFLPDGLIQILAIIASLGELIFGLLLIFGLFTRWAAIGSGLLSLLFALCMTISFGIKAPLNYSVFAVCAGSFVLATLPGYRWSIDHLLAKSKS